MAHSIDDALEQISRITEEETAKSLAQRLGLPYAQLDGFEYHLETLELVPVETVERDQFAAFAKTQEAIKVAVVHAENQETRDLVQKYGAAWPLPVEITVVSASSLRQLLTNYVRLRKEREEAEKRRNLQMQEEAAGDYLKKTLTLETLQEEADGASTTKLLDLIMGGALQNGVSDIHVEPGQENLVVRYRIDGVLDPVLKLPMSAYHDVLSRLKIAAQLDLVNDNQTQDGRFSLKERGIAADVRVSALPTGYGQAVVMRILRQDTQTLSLHDLGFSDYNLKRVKEAVEKPYGLVLVTGPTGSGKSTTLYALLHQLNTPERKIITLEDPVEYRVEGLQQSQVDPERGYTFAEGLRGILRQDPDVVMVGEIRDKETAEIALNASLTGHLVLSTLHTNNAVSTATRLLEMGVQPFLLIGSLRAVIAQRLVRKVAPGSTEANPKYKGRVVVSEVLLPSNEFEQALVNHAAPHDLEAIAEKDGMVPMAEDGLQKVRDGITTEAELKRVTEV